MKNWLVRKDPDAGKDWRQEEKGTTDDEIVGRHPWLDGHEFEQALGLGNWQGSLACCSPWSRKESEITEWLNWTEVFLLCVCLCVCVRMHAKTNNATVHHPVMFDSSQPHGLQHARLPCPASTPGAYSNSCPSSQWCHPTISSNLLLLSSIFPSIRVFSGESVLCIRWPKYWSFRIHPSNEYTGLISL